MTTLTPEQEELNVAAYRAFLQGKPTEYKSIATGEWLLDECFEESIRAGVEMRPKPAWKLADPPERREWHFSTHSDFTEDDLAGGCRPLLKGEAYKNGDEFWNEEKWKVETCATQEHTAESCPFKTRTRRPLPTPPKLRPWSHEEIPVGNVIKTKDGNMVRMITGKSDGHVLFGLSAPSPSYVMEHYTMDDGSPCGVLE